jgi:MOSC domain-containing protein YiiM
MSIITGLYAGRAGVLEPGGERSAILKRPLARATVTRLGIVGDEQADRRYHGGPDQALHQFAQASYARIAQMRPALAGVAVPGSIGENLSCTALDEEHVCIGDRYRIGEVELEVSQPRRPCSKIDARYATPGLARLIDGQRMPGWYLRVRREGEIAIGDPVELVARPNPAVSVARLLAILAAHRPAAADLRLLVECAGLGADWRRRIRERLDFTTREAGGSS